MVMLALPLAAAIAAAQPTEDPLLPARSGKLQCYVPDTARRTCHALAGYRLGADGSYANRAEIPLSADGRVTMTTTTPVLVQAGAVCGTVREEDLARADFRVAGSPMPPDQVNVLLPRLIEAMRAVIGHEVCTRYLQGGGTLTARASLDGTSRPELDQPVIWVDPSEGYRVGH